MLFRSPEQDFKTVAYSGAHDATVAFVASPIIDAAWTRSANKEMASESSFWASCCSMATTWSFTCKARAPAWAWAVLDYWPDSDLIDMYKAKIASLDEKQISKLDYVQLFQASYAFEQFSPHGALMSGELLAHSREVWEQISSARVTISALHQDVSGALTRMGIPHEIEYLTQDNLF